jgi:alpha-1,3-rhamnosyl/mannosyltransferase
LCVSNSYPHKRLEIAAEACGRLQGRFPHRLVIVGRPRRGEALLARAVAGLPEPERVTRLHYVDRDDLVALYQAADAFLLPSAYEGFGLPLLEALAAGVPAVATTAGALPEVGGDAYAAVRPGDAAAFAAAVESALRLSPEARAGQIARGRERAALFTWDATAAATVAACERARDGG